MTAADKVVTDGDRNTALLEWYAVSHRALPWRKTSDPYAILVAEVMLQQTQSDRVVPYYQRSLERFPSVEALAAASLGDVLRVWSGLGYNARAKRLHEAAGIIAADGWPHTVEMLEQLPGVGSYTAAAVGSFAFSLHTPVVDTNVKRVLSRWHGEPLRGATLSSAAETDLAGSNAAVWNQAVMELGATRCTPRSPQCGGCPVAEWCAGPEVYQAPPVQRRFEGSGRQLRGSIVRRLVSGPASLAELMVATGFDPGSVEEAIGDLAAEGLVVIDDHTYRLPG